MPGESSVKKIYPDAICVQVTKDKPLIVNKHLYIIYSNSITEYKNVIGAGSTSTKAWDSAIRFCGIKMLKILES